MRTRIRYENGAEKVFAIAQEKDYTIVSMKNDWNEFSDEDKPELTVIDKLVQSDETVVKEH